MHCYRLLLYSYPIPIQFKNSERTIKVLQFLNKYKFKHIRFVKQITTYINDGKVCGGMHK